MTQHMIEQRCKKELEAYEETAGLTEELYDSEDITTIMNVSDRIMGASQSNNVGHIPHSENTEYPDAGDHLNNLMRLAHPGFENAVQKFSTLNL